MSGGSANGDIGSVGVGAGGEQGRWGAPSSRRISGSLRRKPRPLDGLCPDSTARAACTATCAAMTWCHALRLQRSMCVLTVAVATTVPQWPQTLKALVHTGIVVSASICSRNVTSAAASNASASCASSCTMIAAAAVLPKGSANVLA
eukprot:scaffold37877_cov60-Phaeocystis_antarctica.AAC.7